MKARDYIRARDVLFWDLWSLLQETGHACCFDCGKELTPDTVNIAMDRHGIILFCPEHAWSRIEIKEFWNKTFGEGKE